jgi:hypothetical protein
MCKPLLLRPPRAVTSSAINWYLKYSPDEPNPDIDLGRQKQIFLTYIR